MTSYMPFRYLNEPQSNELARFDPSLPLPPRAAPTPRLLVNINLHRFFPREKYNPEQSGIIGVQETIGKSGTPYLMPANLTRLQLDSSSDDFFVERRLNGFSPGRFQAVEEKPWQYIIHYEYQSDRLDPGSILPNKIQARFVVNDEKLEVHSIEYELNGEITTNSPCDAEWEWAKKLFRNVEFVFQETQAHLARAHLNMEQYAMAYYRNVKNNPIALLLESHFEGLLNINQVGNTIIFGEIGVIPNASVLNEEQVKDLLEQEIRRLNYRTWQPHSQMLKDKIANNHFDRAATAMWEISKDYVEDFFNLHLQGIEGNWSEIEMMSKDLEDNSILDPQYGTLSIDNIRDLKKLCLYVIYHSTFWHSWVNYKQYEDGGDPEFAPLGLWDEKHCSYDRKVVFEKHLQQVLIAWTLSSVRYNPIMENGSTMLKDLIWQRKEEIEPGLPLSQLMMSIHI